MMRTLASLAVAAATLFAQPAHSKPLTPDQLSAFMASELARWTPVAQAAATK